MVRAFSAVPELLRALREHGLKISIASSAKKEKLEVYLRIAETSGLIDEIVSSEDVSESKPARMSSMWRSSACMSRRRTRLAIHHTTRSLPASSG